MLARRAALGAALASALAAGCASTGERALDPATVQQIHERIEAMGTLRGMELEENIRMLGEYLGPISVPYLVEALGKHPNPKVRAGVASAIGVSQDGRGIEPLAACAKGDGDSGVRYTAAYSLLLFRDARGFPLMFEVLHSDDPMRRRVGIDRLKELTGLDQGYDPAAPKEQREEAAARWERWFQEAGPQGAAASIRGARRPASRQ